MIKNILSYSLFAVILIQQAHSGPKGLNWPKKNVPEFSLDVRKDSRQKSCIPFHTNIITFSNFSNYRFSPINKVFSYTLMNIDDQTVFQIKGNTYSFQWVTKKFEDLKDTELKLAQYYKANSNSNIKFMYPNGYDQNINNLWGIRVDQNYYVTVWVKSEDHNNLNLLLVDNECKTLAIKTPEGNISFQAS